MQRGTNCRVDWENTACYPVSVTALFGSPRSCGAVFFLVHWAHGGSCLFSLQLMQQTPHEMTPKFPHPFSARENRGNLTSFRIPFMGARLPNVKTHTRRSRTRHKHRKLLSTRAKYLDPTKSCQRLHFLHIRARCTCLGNQISDMILIQSLSPHGLHISNSLCV